MSKRAHHSDGEDDPNSIVAQAAKAEKQSKQPKGVRASSLRAKPESNKKTDVKKDNKKEAVKTNAPKLRTFSLRNPTQDQSKINNENICKKLLKNYENIDFLCCYTLSSNETFILTPTHFFLAKKNFKLEDKDSYTFPWNYLERFKITKYVELKFKSLSDPPPQKEQLEFKLKFEKNDFDEAVGRICNVLQNVLIPRELRVLKFYDLDAPKVPISALSAFYRFRMLNSVAKLNSKTAKEIEDIIIYSQPEIDVSSLPEEADKILPVIYKLLPFLYNVQTIKIPPNSLPIEDSFKPIRDTNSLFAIKISGEFGKNLQEFLKDATQSEDRGTQLRGILFNKSNFNSDDLEIISNFIPKTKVRSIGFNNAIKQEILPDFYASFLNPKVTDYLFSLNLDGTLNLDIEKIFPRLRKVALLSLANCDLNLLNVFQQLTKYSGAMSQLQMINLSNNIIQTGVVSEFPENDSKLPSRLTGIVVSGITWGNNLKNFLEFIFNHIESKLKLTLSDAQVEDQEWADTFKLLNETEYSGFSELVWDNNPISESLFTFLMKNKDLIRLQINGCLTYSKENEITSFCNFIKKATALEGLVVRGGSGEYNLGKFTSNVIEAAREAKQLVFLDIGDSKAGQVIEKENANEVEEEEEEKGKENANANANEENENANANGENENANANGENANANEENENANDENENANGENENANGENENTNANDENANAGEENANGDDADKNENAEEKTTALDEANTSVNNSLEQLSLLCKDSTKLEYLNYDGMMPNTSKPYITMLTDMKKSSKRVNISFPTNDLRSLSDKQLLRPRRLLQIKNEFSFLQCYNFSEKQFQKSKDAKKSTIDIYPWPDSAFSKPSSLYRLYDPPSFPYYVNLKDENKLKSSSQPFSLSIDNDYLRWDPEAQQPLRSLTQEKFDLQPDDQESKPKARSQKSKPRFGSVRIPHKSNLSLKGVKSLPIAQSIENESKKKEEDIKRRERKAKLEQERLEKERQEQERQEKEREEQERQELEKQELKRKEQERQEKEREEQERQEKERQEKEREEQERQEKERQEKEREEQERQEKERQEKERQEKEREEQERQEKERQEKEREEQERQEKEREEQERQEKERQEKEREEQERREQLRIDKKLGIKERSITIDNHDSMSLSVEASDSNDSNDSNDQEQVKPRNIIMPSSSGSLKPPIPLRKSPTPSSEFLLEPDYSLDAKSFYTLNYPINWEKIDGEITLDNLYQKLSREKRSDLMTRLSQQKPKRK